MDFKAINDILTSKYMVPVVIAITITFGIMYYIKKEDTYLFGGILSASFLTVIFICYLYKKCIDHLNKKRRKKLQLEKDKNIMSALADEALTFFKSLNTSAIENAIRLYNHSNDKTRFYNERYVDFGEEPGWRVIGFLSQFQTSYPTVNYRERERYYIGCDNEQDCHNGGSRHIVFDEMFYVILKNYVETGKYDYPVEFDVLSLKKAYSKFLYYPDER